MALFYQEILNNIMHVTMVSIIPTIVQYDQGTEGRGSFKQAVVRSGARLIRSGVAYPQRNGGVEQFIEENNCRG